MFVTVQEELTFRGYTIKNLAEGFNGKVIGPRCATVIAVLIPPLLFGLGHFDNPNATTLSTINIIVFAGLFGAGYVLTGELALPIGLHFAWDFVQGFVLGVTGQTSKLRSFLASRKMIQQRSSGRDSLTGLRVGCWEQGRACWASC